MHQRQGILSGISYSIECFEWSDLYFACLVASPFRLMLRAGLGETCFFMPFFPGALLGSSKIIDQLLEKG